MRHALDEIARTTGEKVDLDAHRARRSRATFELIRRSDTLGCFQIESPGQRELLQKLQPTRWEDLIVDISLFRPGPVKSDMIAPYLRRRAAWRRPTYIHPGLRRPLQETFGVIVYHEQVIRTLSAIAGYTETHADHIRRHLDHEDMLPGFREDFLAKATERGVDRGAAERDLVRRDPVRELRVLQGARRRVRGAHLPERLAEGALPGAPDRRPADPRSRHVPQASDPGRRSPARHPDPAARRQPERTRLRGRAGRGRRSAIRLGLQDVHGISDAEIRSVLQARVGAAVPDVEDFMRRTTVSRPVTEGLAHAGAFEVAGAPASPSSCSPP